MTYYRVSNRKNVVAKEADFSHDDARSWKYPAERNSVIWKFRRQYQFQESSFQVFPAVAGSVRESPLLNGESQSGTPKPFFHSLIYGINLAAANSWLTFEIVIYYS